MQERFVEKNKHLLQECTNVQSVDGSCLCVGAWVVACVGGCVRGWLRGCVRACVCGKLFCFGAKEMEKEKKREAGINIRKIGETRFRRCRP